MLNITTYTASEARNKLYKLVKKASIGINAYEIKLRGSDSVLLISKDEVESWLETLDILSNPEEAKAIDKARKSEKLIPHEQVVKELG